MMMTFSPPAFHITTKPRGAICNLDCKYCYYLSKETFYPDNGFRMSDNVLETYTSEYIAAQQINEVTFSWQGGEPTLMGLEFYKRAIHYQQKYARPGMRIQNTLQTNGTLLDEDWCYFFRKNNFLIGISMDGTQSLHDVYRLDKGRAGSFEDVLRGWRLLQSFGVETNVLCSVHAANQEHPLNVYRFFRDELKAQFIQFIPIVERQSSRIAAGVPLAEYSVNSQQYGQFLIAIFDEWLSQDVGRVFVQMFDVALGAWLGQPGGLCVFAPTCGTALALEHNGDLYSCDHFVETDYLLGNIEKNGLLELATSEKQGKFGRVKQTSLPRYCRDCEVLFACNGGCPKDRFINTPNGELGLNYLCAGYKAFFTYIDHPMKVMAGLFRQSHSPADIMNLLAIEDKKTREIFR